MRILVLGAGATGGYFGGRFLQAHCDVAFLVRPARAETLRRDGLVIRSAFGDAALPVQAYTTADVTADWDLVFLSCKAYDLEDAITTLAPAMAPDTKILPVLNGLAHLDRLDAVFGPERVLGGLCQIAATLAGDGAIVHLNKLHVLAFGHRLEPQRGFCEALQENLRSARVEVRRSEVIVHEMWEKWVMLSTLAASTCLMRASIGDIAAAPGGTALVLGMLQEAVAIAAAYGYGPRPDVMEWIRDLLTASGSTLAASMMRDIESGRRIEADHVIGDLLARGAARGLQSPLLGLALTHLKAYEARRDRAALPGA